MQSRYLSSKALTLHSPKKAGPMRLLISFAALFLSVIFLQLGAGALGPFDVIVGSAHGFSATEVGFLGSAHFSGFLIGCWWTPRLMGQIGHSRVFAAFATFGLVGILLHPLWPDPLGWALMRVLSGMSIAGCYTVIEAWMQAKLTNDNRGRIMGVYRVIDIIASSAAQMMIGFLSPESYVAYSILALFVCAALLPVTLTSSVQPQLTHTPRLRPLYVMRLSPLAVAGVAAAGVSSSSFRMVGPLFAQETGLLAQQIGWFMAIVLIGGAIAQFPVGWVADRYERRRVLSVLSLLSVLVCLGLSLSAGQASPFWLFAQMFVFGLATFPIFSVSAAHACDQAGPDEMVEVNASLLFIYAIGAILSPTITAKLIGVFGPGALFMYIAGVHFLLLAFSILRAYLRGPSDRQVDYTYMPRTSFVIPRLLGRKS